MKLVDQLARALPVLALVSASLLVAGCSGADPDSEDPAEATSTSSEALQAHAWNHICRTSRRFFLYDNGTPLGGNAGEWVGQGHAVYVYNLSPAGLVHVGDNVGKGHYGWISRADLCNGA